jgi:hypothetical protein
MEHQDGAPSDGVVAAPFSELIRAWLDEGDRLDEKAIATAASGPAVSETRAGRLLSFLRPALDRHRVLVFAGVGLVPFVLFTLTHRSASTPAPVVATAIVARAPAAPFAPPPPPEGAGICESNETAPALLGVRSPDPRPAAPRPHHHHHHLAAKPPAPCGRAPCAVARTAPPSAHLAPTAIALPGAHPGPAAVAPPARPGAPAGLVAFARPAAPLAHAAPAAPPRRSSVLMKGQPLR